MADAKISELTAVGTLALGDQFAIVDVSGGVSRSATINQIVADIFAPSAAAIYITTAAATTISATDTPVKASGTTALSSEFTAQNFTMPTNNRLTYTGTNTAIVHVGVSFSLTAASSNQVLNFYLAKNGSVSTESKIQRKIGTGSDVGAAALQATFSMATNDYVELWVENTTTATNVTIEFMNMVATSLPIPA